MMYYDTNGSFGEAGPFEANSKEELANEYADQFAVWASEKVQKMLQEGHEFDSEETPEEDFTAEFKAEFIKGLEEV